ncbi:hypothetical protein F070042J6_13470 [Bacteroides sp. f07]|nr:hypothetical protein [uncultured Bacteroides sp.]
MADNYLEKQREQYEAKKAAWLKMKKYGKKKNVQSKTEKIQPPQQPESK